jgi:uncharacterized membrane protein
MFQARTGFLGAIGVALFTAIVAGSPPAYKVTIIDHVPGTDNGAGWALNDRGWVAGVYGTQAYGDTYGYRTFLWKPGEGAIDVGHPEDLVTLLPQDLTNDGVIVGRAAQKLIQIDTNSHVWSWRDGQFTVYDQLVAGRAAWPGFTNNAARIVGYANDGSFIGKFALEWFPDGSFTRFLADSEGYTSVLDVNNFDVLMGTEIRGVFLWEPGQDLWFFPPPSASEPKGSVQKINDRKDAAGSTQAASHAETRTAVVWIDGEGWHFIPRAARRNVAADINNRREVIGNSQDNAGAIGDHAWYWRKDTGMIPLENLIAEPSGVYAVSFARDINERGQIIAGLFVRETGEGVSALLTPIRCDADFDFSGFVDLEDYTAFVESFEAGSADADVDGSGFVDFEDFSSFVRAFEAGC